MTFDPLSRYALRRFALKLAFLSVAALFPDTSSLGLQDSRNDAGLVVGPDKRLTGRVLAGATDRRDVELLG
jgi:hypothetical protein